MEPVTVIAGACLAAWLAQKLERVERRRKEGPATIPDLLASSDIVDDASLMVVAIHIRHATLAPVLAGKHLKARVKYGRCGDSVRCDSGVVEVPTSSRPAGARFVGRKPGGEPALLPVDFNTTCLFLVHNRLKPQIRLRLVRAGPLGRVVAKADISVVSILENLQMDVLLDGVGAYSGSRSLVGIALQTFCTQKADLKDCLRKLGARQQMDGFSMG
eukprot:CAMPEP_0203861778 /NCGR_PEP_ID=MMETSP0359-20131031/13212_1 /ASSEMBLY_ACC=CAM_ASM_000338 /TAXON_ID=268821 /ORGANISM="Scrippsiella Hangoei, Strain SHTV-5" /LENGTH=215 /DNA_ID=CAMNT_0050779073 /DNA_START=107 /DNA_END=751 /DNA_ORIENTATION=-